MRNPLSAILQCSDEISASLTEFKATGERLKSAERLQEMLDNSIDAAQTITLCAQHQVSKLGYLVSDIITNFTRNALLMTFSRCLNLIQLFWWLPLSR